MSEGEFEVIELSVEELRALLARVKPSVAPEDYKTLEYLADTHIHLTHLLAEKDATIQKLRKLFISPFQSEKLCDVFPETENAPAAENISEPEKGPEPPEAEAKPQESEPSGHAAPAEDLPPLGEDEKIPEPEKGPEPPAAEGKPEAAEPSGDGAPSEAPPPAGDGEGKKDEGAPDEGPKKGHGRNGADKYEGAETILVQHESLKPGDPCPVPRCKGKLYEYVPPAVLIRIVGRSPVGATVSKLQRLRCGDCNTVFTAKPPEGLGTEKYDATAASIIAVLRYGTGVPFYRLERLQKNFRIPLPDATQWDIVESAVNPMVPVYKALLYEAAQGEVVYNDDTRGKVLDLMKEMEKAKKKNEGKADDG